MKKGILELLKSGTDIGGAVLSPIAAKQLALGDPIGAGATQTFVVLLKATADKIEKYQTEQENARVATAVIIAFNKIEQEIANGKSIRNDDFFRERTGEILPARRILDGVIAKSKTQFEERKLTILGNLLANSAFNEMLSADDISWLLMSVDGLTYRQLLMIAHFFQRPTSGWNSNNIKQIAFRSPFVLVQLEDLRVKGFIGGISTFETPVDITVTGRLLAENANLLQEYEIYGNHLRELIGTPTEWLGVQQSEDGVN